MYQDLTIIDFHCHFPAANDISMAGAAARTYEPGSAAGAKAEYLKQQAEKYRVAWRQAWDFPEPEKDAPSPEVQADRWLAELDTYGISHVGFATGGGNDTLAGVVERHKDRFIGFAHHNLFKPGAAEELERAVTQLGLKGLKVLAPALERPVNERELYPVWEVCEQLGIPGADPLRHAGRRRRHLLERPRQSWPAGAGGEGFPNGRVCGATLRDSVREGAAVLVLVLPERER